MVVIGMRVPGVPPLEPSERSWPRIRPLVNRTLKREIRARSYFARCLAGCYRNILFPRDRYRRYTKNGRPPCSIDTARSAENANVSRYFTFQRISKEKDRFMRYQSNHRLCTVTLISIRD